MGTTNKPSATGINVLQTFMNTTNIHKGFYFLIHKYHEYSMNYIMTISDDKMSTDTPNR